MKANLYPTLAAIAFLSLSTWSALPTLGAPSSKSSSKSSSSRTKAEAVETLPASQRVAQELAEDLTTTQESKLLTFLNEADVKELAVIQGISTRRGAAIDKARPFDSVDEVVLVAGIGEGTFSELVKYGKTLTRSRSTSSSSRSSSSRSKS